jgi:hypothetical protein
MVAWAGRGWVSVPYCWGNFGWVADDMLEVENG